MEKVDNNTSKKSNRKGKIIKEWCIKKYGEEKGLERL